MINSTRSYLTTVVTACLLTGFLFFAGTSVPVVREVNLKGRDIFFNLRHLFSPLPSSADEIVLVNLDDETLKRLEFKWPYPRQIYAEALKRLQPFSPKAIGFDLIFSGQDITPESDSAFVSALKEVDNVVVASHRSSGGEVGPSSLIREGAREVGIVDKPRDLDHVIRNAFLSFAVGGKEYPSWETALFQKAFLAKNTSGLSRNSETVINYRLQLGEFPQISFWRLLEGSVLAQEIRNKIVLIGLTAETFHDIHETPLGLMPGLAVNANVLMMLMNRDFFSSAPRWSVPILSFFSFWLTLLTALSNPFGVVFLMIVGLILVFLTVSFLLFLNQVILDLWLVALGIILTLIVAIVFKEAQLFLIRWKLKKESARDPLTGFYNQKFLLLKLELEFYHRSELSIILLGLDHFGATSSSGSRFDEDDALQKMAESVRSSVRKDELICRYGENKFCVVLPNTSAQDAVKFAVKIRKLIQEESSGGIISLSTVKIHNARQFLKAAETVLTRAQSSGGNQICVFDSARGKIH